MRILHPTERLAGPTVVTVGTFDGVHLGHQRLIAAAQALAERNRATLVVLTFDRHPLSVIRPAMAPRLLTPLDQKLEALAALAVPWVKVLSFTPELARTGPEQFLDQELGQALAASGVAVGYNFTFGAGGRGTAETLAQWGARRGVTVEVLPPVQLEGVGVVSSSWIRKRIEAADFEAARAALGRPYAVAARVETGMGRGRRIGVPTANLTPDPDQVMPPFGVYAGWALVGSGAQPVAAVANWGLRPTFGDAESPVLEVHLLDGTGWQLVGQRLAFGFVRRLRGEQRFSSVEALVAQIGADIETARASLGEAKPAIAPGFGGVIQ